MQIQAFNSTQENWEQVFLLAIPSRIDIYSFDHTLKKSTVECSKELTMGWNSGFLLCGLNLQ